MNANLEKEGVTIASKISLSDKRKLYAIADELGLTFYNMVQACLLTLIRYWDKGSAVTAEHRCMMEAFFHVLQSTLGSFNPISRRNKNNEDIKGMILFVTRKKNKRPQLLEVHKDEFGNMIESYNYDAMLKDFLGAIDPNALQRLEDETKELGNISITQTLQELIMQRTTPEADMMKSEVNDLFSDVRIRTGQRLNVDVHYKQGYRNNLNEYTTITPNETYRADL